VEALRAGARRGLADGPFKQRLERLLEQRRAELADPAVALPDADVRPLERAFACPFALVSREVEDVAVHRLNEILPVILRIHTRPSTPMEPDKTEQPQRFLRAYLERYPYFRRIELRPGRGLRPPEAMVGDPEPEREVRNPP
jgi:hypothetical protein